MTTDTRDRAAVEKELWRELERVRCGMLGAGQFARGRFMPMAAFPEAESGKIWFYSHRGSDLAGIGEQGGPAVLIVMGKDQELQACIRGELRTSFDTLHRDKFWGPAVSAWFPKGKGDPDLTLLCLACEDADVWISDAGRVKFGWEIVKANLTGSTPDLGGRVHVTFRTSAGRG
jgi:general stress protein 26